MSHATQSSGAVAVFALGVGCLAGLAAGATGGGPATGAVPLIAAFAFHAAHFALKLQAGARFEDSSMITHVGAGALSLVGFLTAHVARWGGKPHSA